ncbi:MAG: hypothetical protein HGA97_07280 [Chlorobiaceae bacterium]|jgi:hypothetical protein|nr:hypothetical protein [Chlorobiaceae bacterium]
MNRQEREYIEITSEENFGTDEIRIQNLQKAFQCSENIKESCHNLIDSVEESLEQLKEKRIDISAKLCEVLARKESLRKKDYNVIIGEIYDLLDEKENYAKRNFITYIEDQKKFTQSLKNILLNISDYSRSEPDEKKEKLREELMYIAEMQEGRKDAVIKILTNFQNTHKKVMVYLESLLEKGENISIKDIKNAKYIIIK